MTPESQTSSNKQHTLQVPDHPSGSSSPLRDIEAGEPHQGVLLDDMEANPRYARSARPRRAGAPPPWWASMFEHYLAASFMMVTSSMVSTFWIDNALPFCSKFWSVLGNADECYWRPNVFMILAACTGYSVCAFWWYNQHKRWPYQIQTIALSLVGGIVLSLILKADLEHILRNTLTWSIFTGLMVSAIMDRRKAPRGGAIL
ncbi:hypothetical protein DBV05_g6717 [Lasiodiplodia theobromae]|uniref:Uncharacterized protein n=1 Tax=Lasiodiplodia theobromae TaxID=45133 RepID=A0A5N5DA08_9PEZI|nr:hypothetical protein DBV05_g6717 [Lasiodiplodia theobromae]